MAKPHRTTITSHAAGAAAAREVEPLTAPPGSVPKTEKIAQLAYSYWQARGCPEGSPEEDWLRAEADLRDATADSR
jgi:Protein of unknown function (DUF2934)